MPGLLQALGLPPGSGIVLGFTAGVLVGVAFAPIIAPGILIITPVLYQKLTGEQLAETLHNEGPSGVLAKLKEHLPDILVKGTYAIDSLSKLGGRIGKD